MLGLNMLLNEKNLKSTIVDKNDTTYTRKK